MDQVDPACQTGQGCPIPKLGATGLRIIEIRALLVRLHNLVDAGTICRVCEVDRGDLELLATIEDELKSSEGKEGGNDGERH